MPCPNVPSRAFDLTHGNLEPYRVRSLEETAEILNQSGHYPRKLKRKDVLRIENQALKKVRIRLAVLL